jgi:hypothetical protein
MIVAHDHHHIHGLWLGRDGQCRQGGGTAACGQELSSGRLHGHLRGGAVAAGFSLVPKLRLGMQSPKLRFERAITISSTHARDAA